MKNNNKQNPSTNVQKIVNATKAIKAVNIFTAEVGKANYNVKKMKSSLKKKTKNGNKTTRPPKNVQPSFTDHIDKPINHVDKEIETKKKNIKFLDILIENNEKTLETPNKNKKAMYYGAAAAAAAAATVAAIVSVVKWNKNRRQQSQPQPQPNKGNEVPSSSDTIIQENKPRVVWSGGATADGKVFYRQQ